MRDVIECLRCHTPMEPGFIADATYGGNVQEKWGPGEARASFWTGLRVDRKTLVPVTTMRCPTCGALGSYAIPAQ
jgi:hypothetical protein